MLDAVGAGGDTRPAEPFGGGDQSGDDPAHRRVADRVESGLDTGFGAGGDVVRDGLVVEIRDAAGIGIGVRFVQQCGVAAEGSVDEQVAGESVGTGPGQDLAGVIGIAGGLTPVSPHVHGMLDPREQSEVPFAGDVGSGILVHGSDAGAGRGLERGGLCRGDLAVAERGDRGGPDGVVRGGGQRTVGRISGQSGEIGNEGPQRGTGLRRMLVDAGGVDDAVRRQVGAQQRRLPGGVVPATGENGVTEGALKGGDHRIARAR
ncbi:hypothetical protein TPAU25S_01622 [Tsukamurella paurometabola]